MSRIVFLAQSSVILNFPEVRIYYAIAIIIAPFRAIGVAIDQRKLIYRNASLFAVCPHLIFFATVVLPSSTNSIIPGMVYRCIDILIQSLFRKFFRFSVQFNQFALLINILQCKFFLVFSKTLVGIPNITIPLATVLSQSLIISILKACNFQFLFRCSIQVNGRSIALLCQLGKSGVLYLMDLSFNLIGQRSNLRCSLSAIDSLIQFILQCFQWLAFALVFKQRLGSIYG